MFSRLLFGLCCAVFALSANAQSSSIYLSSPPTLTSGQVAALMSDVNGNLKVNVAANGSPGPTNPSTFVTGQLIIVTTGTQVCAPSAALQNGLIVKSLPSNSSNKQTIGPTGVTNVVNGSGNGYVLSPGEAGSVGIANASSVCVNGTVGDIFTYIGN